MAKMSDKTKRAINKGRKNAGLKPIKFKSSIGIKEKRKALKPMKKIEGYQKCSLCDKKTVGSRDAWFQDFTSQKRLCAKCIKKIQSKKSGK